MSPRAGLLVLCGLSFPAVALGQGVSIDHQGVGCVLAGKFPRFDARLDPAEAVARARVNFRPEGTAHWYAVEMKPEAGVFHGILPKPQKSLNRFSYYIDVTDKAFHASRTAEFLLDVASGPAACGRQKVLAAGLSKANVFLHGPEGVAGAPSVPAGFSADGVVTASGTAATGGLGAKAVILGTVLAGGAAAAVVATTSGDDSAPSGPPPSTMTGGPPPTTLPAPSPSPTANLTGTWAGNRPADGMVLNFSGCGFCTNTPSFAAGNFTLNLTDSSGALSGSGTFTTTEAPPVGCPAEPNCTQGSPGDVSTGTVMGTVSGTSVSMQLSLTTPGAEPVPALITLSGTLSGNRMSGTAILTASNIPGGTANGTWAVNRQ